MNFIGRMAAGLSAFREAYVTADLVDSSAFEAFNARRIRYDIFASWYDSTVFRDLIHMWSPSYRSAYGLYKYIRNIYNPTFRTVEFWKWMIWGGLLDPHAVEEGAIPIRTDSDSLRDSIATLWQDSNWDVNKDLVTMFGASFGDIGIKIVDDPNHGQVRLEPIHPKTIKSLTVDGNGYIKSYTLEEQRILPETDRAVTFTEMCTRGEGDEVKFETLADGKPYPWNGKAASWSMAYGFVPFVAIQHIRVGLNFGWPEIYPVRTKFQELEDLASKMHDYIRKVTDPVWLFNFKQPKGGVDLQGASRNPTINQPQPGREEMPAIYVADPNAKGQPLVTSNVDVNNIGIQLQHLIEELERDLPELQMDIWAAGGYTTGKALSTARQRVERKIIQRRPEYDKGLTRAHQMAIAIGGYQGYEGYDGFDLLSFDAGLLDHVIPSDRPMFDIDTTEDLQDKQILWNIIINAKKNGLPIDEVLLSLGWSQDKVDKFLQKLVLPEPVVPGADTATGTAEEVTPGQQTLSQSGSQPNAYPPVPGSGGAQNVV